MPAVPVVDEFFPPAVSASVHNYVLQAIQKSSPTPVQPFATACGTVQTSPILPQFVSIVISYTHMGDFTHQVQPGES
jgi:hypothetical protein